MTGAVLRGRLKRWIGSKHYGFVKREDGRPDEFLLESTIVHCGVSLAALEAGAEIEFATDLDRHTGRRRITWLALVEPDAQVQP
jgi:cold shock CspA family protein